MAVGNGSGVGWMGRKKGGLRGIHSRTRLGSQKGIKLHQLGRLQMINDHEGNDLNGAEETYD